MSVKLRLSRMGRRHRPFFRINAIESRMPRDGQVLEKLGHYDPIEKDPEKQIVLNRDRAEYWLSKGAIPSETVSQLLLRQGIKHKHVDVRTARRERAKAIAKVKGKPFDKAQRIAIQKVEEQAKAKAEAEAKAAEEKAKAEAQAKAASEKAKAEAETKAAEEKTKAEAEAKAAEEKTKAEAETKAAEEKTKAEAEAKAAEKKAKAQEETKNKTEAEAVKEKPDTKAEVETQPETDSAKAEEGDSSEAKEE